MCGLVIQTEGDKVTDVRGDKDDPDVDFTESETHKTIQSFTYIAPSHSPLSHPLTLSEYCMQYCTQYFT